VWGGEEQPTVSLDKTLTCGYSSGSSTPKRTEHETPRKKQADLPITAEYPALLADIKERIMVHFP
jgi:hypothetical protein